jgi:subtilisin family serine protease
VLYAAYYNGGVRALDVRGDLKTCLPSQQQFTSTGNITRCDLRLMGREIGVGLVDLNRGVYVWGVQYLGGTIYASDMVNGIWKLKAAK